MALFSKFKDDEAIEITKDNLDEDPDWKIVGSSSRRESFSQHSNSNHQPQQEFVRRSSITSEKQWGSFGGFQWEGSSIFEEEKESIPVAPNIPDPFNLTNVPTLPHVSLEPTYRPQRSLSFSMGQDPAFFGYNDYNTTSFLAPTPEEDEDQSDANRMHHSLDDVYFRSRSVSSNAAFGLYSPPGNDVWNTRRSSFGFPSLLLPHSSVDPLKDSTPPRRLSQPFNTNHNFSDYTLPEIIPNGIPTNNNNAFINLSSTTSSIKSLSDILENTYLNNDDNAGKGMLIQKLPASVPLYMVEFKSGRTDFYYADTALVKVGDLVLVEADRGKDLGKVATDVLTINQVLLLQQQQQNSNSNRLVLDENDVYTKKANDIYVKKIYRKATTDEVQLLPMKEEDEQKALSICLQKIKTRKLQMEVVDAEFQWDRRKLTFYFITEKRIDFRELVRELFKIYKTRIWMCAVNSTIPIKSVTLPNL